METQTNPCSVSKEGTEPCDHTFCSRCIEQWAQIKSTCPLCRSPFDYITPARENAGDSVKRKRVRRAYRVGTHEPARMNNNSHMVFLTIFYNRIESLRVVYIV